MNGSVHLSIHQYVRLSHFFHCFCHRIIIKFSGVIIMDKSDVHAKSHSQSSKAKVKELKRNFTLIWAFLALLYFNVR